MQTCENMLADMGTHFILDVTLGMDAVHVNTMSMSTDICAGMDSHLKAPRKAKDAAHNLLGGAIQSAPSFARTVCFI